MNSLKESLNGLYEINKINNNKDIIKKIIKRFIPKLYERHGYHYTVNCYGDEDLYINYNGKNLFFKVDKNGIIVLYDLNCSVNYKRKHKYHKQKSFRSWINAISYLKTLHLPKNMNKKKMKSSIDRMFDKIK